MVTVGSGSASATQSAPVGPAMGKARACDDVGRTVRERANGAPPSTLSDGDVDSMESVGPPPAYGTPDAKRRRELAACFWLLALAPAWRSTLYTFPDLLYAEQAGARRNALLLRQLAYEMREFHPVE